MPYAGINVRIYVYVNKARKFKIESVSEKFSVEPVNERTERCCVEGSEIGSAIQGEMRSNNTIAGLSWNVLLGVVL